MIGLERMETVDKIADELQITPRDDWWKKVSKNGLRIAFDFFDEIKAGVEFIVASEGVCAGLNNFFVQFGRVVDSDFVNMIGKWIVVVKHIDNKTHECPLLFGVYPNAEAAMTAYDKFKLCDMRRKEEKC